MILKKNKFVIISAEVARTSEISIAAKGLYVYLCLFESLDHVTIKGISMDLRENELTIGNAMRELEAADYVDQVR